jgi:hypothetical protein
MSKPLSDDDEDKFHSFFYEIDGEPFTKEHRLFLLKRKKFIELCRTIGVIPLVSMDEVIRFYGEVRGRKDDG